MSKRDEIDKAAVYKVWKFGDIEDIELDFETHRVKDNNLFVLGSVHN